LSLGLIGAARVVPIVVLALGGGVAADAFDRRRIMLATQTVMALASAALAATTYAGVARPWLIYALIGVSGAATAFDSPARQTLVTNLLPREDLENGLTISITGFQVATTAGPALGGLLLAATNVETVYAVDAVSYVALLAALVVVRPRPEVTARRTVGVGAGALREAVAFLKKERVIVWLMVLDFAATFLAGAMQLMPFFANDVYHAGARGLGWLLSAYPLGALACSLVLSSLRPIRRQGAAVLVAILVYGAAIGAFGAVTTLPRALALLAVAGAGDTVSTVIRQVVRQTLTPDEMRGRMTGFNMVFFIGGPQLGEVEAGAIAELVGARASVVAGGVACVVVAGLVAAFVPLVRTLTAARPAPQAVG
ncbi:MAG TPA: MFS transporter, partial [Minicystis sp.]|nr:MFS transporter [Minicystis sp.]